MALATRLQLSLVATLTNAIDLSTAADPLGYSVSDSLASGTGLDQADVLWHDRRTLNAASSEDLDLAASLTNAFGATVTFAKVKAILIKNRTTTAGYVLAVGGASATQFSNWVANVSDIVNIGPDGLFLLWNPSLAGYAVGAGSTDLLKINNANAGAVEYDIIIIGTSA